MDEKNEKRARQRNVELVTFPQRSTLLVFRIVMGVLHGEARHLCTALSIIVFLMATYQVRFNMFGDARTMVWLQTKVRMSFLVEE